MPHSNGRVAGENGGNSSGEDGDKTEKRSCLQRFSEIVMGTLENGFSTLGYKIGSRPVLFMVVSVILCFLTGIGLLAFNEETAPEKLWVPNGATVTKNKEWIDDNFPSKIVREQFIATSGNILKADKIKGLYDFYKQSMALSTSSGLTFNDVCVKAGPVCIVYGVLEVWSYDETQINALTDAQVLIDINAATVSPVYGREFEWISYLGGISYDNANDIVSAKAVYMTWLAEGSDSMKSKTQAWEEKFISLGKKGNSELRDTYVWAGRSWDDESGKAIQGDIAYLSIGYIIVIIFVFCVLGNYNFLEQRIWLTLGGFVCIGLSLLVSVGLSSAFQQVYGPLQSVLPFLLLGIGVDDMFVILGALNNLTPEEKECDIPELTAKVLGHAGVSITVTSLTDFVAFIIGATTIIPALRSFCVYAAIGILALYFLQTTFFTACLTFDIKRIRANRDGCFCCVKRKDGYEPNKCSQKQFVPFVFKKGLAQIITKLPVKVVVIVATLALFGVNLWGFIELEQYFDPYWFIPDDSYATEFLDIQSQYFASVGDQGHVYCGQLVYYNSSTELVKLNELMVGSKYITNGTTDSWFEILTNWFNTTSDASVLTMLAPNKYPTTRDNFLNLTYRMTDEYATRTKTYIQFVSSSDLTITASRFPFDHISMSDAPTEIDAMDDTYDLVKRAGFSSDDCFPFSRRYLTWETNKIIKEELYRNLLLAMICVFLVGLILIANVFTTLYVFLGVVFTLVDVAGTMHFWDLTIDTVTSVILILSIGLAVDYSAHIGHMFMRVVGTREERVKETVREIGPPVFFGGFSTFLAFVLLANSNSYVFRTFFKVNFLVVLYGLFHGLIFLPVILSIGGPDPYPTATLEYQNSKKNKEIEKTDDGVRNPGFQPDDNKRSEMTNLSNLPPLGKKPHQYNDEHKNGNVDLNMSQSSTEISGRDSPPPNHNSFPNPDNPHITVIRM